MKRMTSAGCCLLLLASGGLLAEDWIDLTHSDGAGLFGEKCGMCHRANGMGTGILARRLSAEQAVLENRTDLQGVYIEAAVRSGVGVMFPISRGEVSDPQLQAIISYLTSDRKAAGNKGEKK